MKTYLKILGIISGLIVLVGISAVFYIYIDEKEWGVLIMLFPIYFLAHYLIGTKFGFTNNSNLYSKYLIAISLATLILIGIVPIKIYYQQERKKEVASYAAYKLEQIKDWGKVNTVHNIECNLKTRIKGGKLEYIFNASFKETNPYVTAFIINFFDSDGFKLSEIEINHWTSIVDSKSERIGIQSTSSINSWDFDANYEDIQRYSVSIKD